MKALLLCLGFLAIFTTHLSAQSRVSIAPTYWFNYNPYSYQVDMAYNGVQTQAQASGHNIVSSFGLTARYQFTTQWSVSVGGLYTTNTDHIESPQSPYGEFPPFTSKEVQVPVLLNYRLTNHRLSPYFSAGTTFTKSKTFREAPIRTDGILGMGLTYRFQSSLSLLLQPTASYSLTKPVDDAFTRFTNYTSYSFGVQTQLIWQF